MGNRSQPDEPDSPMFDGYGSPDEAEYPPAAARPARQSLSGVAHRRAPIRGVPTLLSSASDPSTSAASGRPPIRRGGYKDPGGLRSSAERPVATPIYVASEKDLGQEFDSIASDLGPACDWQKRIAALERVDGLLAGGAADYSAAFDAALRALRDPLTRQVVDRRSAVSRSACHTVGQLSLVLGPRFEGLALHLLPELFKMVVITVQVIAESSEAAVRTLLHHCRGARLLPKLCDALTRDRSSKLRQICGDALLQVLEEWDTASLERGGLDNVTNAIRAACGDAVGEIRAKGRMLFSALMQRFPERASALLPRLDKSVQKQITAAMAAYTPGQHTYRGIHSAVDLPPQAEQAASQHRAAPRRPSPPPEVAVGQAKSTTVPFQMTATAGSTRQAIGVSLLPPAPSRQTYTEPAPPLRTAQPLLPYQLPSRLTPSSEVEAASRRSAAAVSSEMQPPPPRRSSRQSIGGAALRVPLRNTSTPTWAGSEGRGEISDSINEGINRSGRPPSRRMSSMIPPRTVSGTGGAARVLSSARGFRAPAPQQIPQYEPNEPAGDSYSVASFQSEAGSKPATMSQLIQSAQAAGTNWAARVAAYEQMGLLLRREGQNALTGAHGDATYLVPAILEHAGDSHFKVAVAALGALRESVRQCSAALEPFLSRLLPLVARRLVDPKTSIREASYDVLTSCVENFAQDFILQAAGKALESVQQPRCKCAILAWFCDEVAPRCSNTAEANSSAITTALRVWTAQVAALVEDKNLELRRASVDTLTCIHLGVDQAVLLHHVVHASRQQQHELAAALYRSLPELHQQVADYRFAAQAASRHAVSYRSHTGGGEVFYGDYPSHVPGLGDVLGGVEEGGEPRREYVDASASGSALVMVEADDSQPLWQKAEATEPAFNSNGAGREPPPNTGSEANALEPASQDYSPPTSLNIYSLPASEIPVSNTYPPLSIEVSSEEMGHVINRRVSNSADAGLQSFPLSPATLAALTPEPCRRVSQCVPIAPDRVASLPAPGGGSPWIGSHLTSPMGCSPPLETHVAFHQVPPSPDASPHAAHFTPPQDSPILGALKGSYLQHRSQESQSLTLNQLTQLSVSDDHGGGVRIGRSNLRPSSAATASALAALAASSPSRIADALASQPGLAAALAAKVAEAQQQSAQLVMQARPLVAEQMQISALRSLTRLGPGKRESPPTSSKPEGVQDEDAARLVRDLVVARAAADPALSAQAMHAVAEKARDCPADIWGRHDLQLVEAVIEALGVEATDGSREAALRLVQAVSSALSRQMSTILPALLAAAAHPSKQVCSAAAAATEAVLSSSPVQQCLPPLCEALGRYSQQGPTASSHSVQAAIKGVRQVLVRAADEDVAAALDDTSLLRLLLAAFGHEAADVRKAVTFCLVDLHLRYGEEAMQPYFADLTPSQAKLVAIYVQRSSQSSRA